uniref:Uncharacterized protein n=1 Tax=Nelumbo nucifera TaxID=4432 RepID=A0A822XLT8_NELNU|nr:TPA_asm: hypothetical protein HUJ06_022700 [Nelumbo nucifera]
MRSDAKPGLNQQWAELLPLIRIAAAYTGCMHCKPDLNLTIYDRCEYFE